MQVAPKRARVEPDERGAQRGDGRQSRLQSPQALMGLPAQVTPPLHPPRLLQGEEHLPRVWPVTGKAGSCGIAARQITVGPVQRNGCRGWRPAQPRQRMP
jgi:hypothetical protein